jgi:hypothetical protein
MKFVGLRAKMYAVDAKGKDTIKKSKGTKKSVVAKRLSMADYLATLHSGVPKSSTNFGFRSKGHEIKTQQQVKVSLSAFDTKRFILDDGISTLPFGHKCIKAIKFAGALRRIVLKLYLRKLRAKFRLANNPRPALGMVLAGSLVE